MSNPMLNDARWGELSQIEGRSARGTTMTVNGAVEKTIILLVLLCAALGGMWWAFWGLKAQPNMQMVMPLTIGGGIAGFVLVLIGSFAPRTTPITAPLYAVAKGVFLGGITMFFEVRYPGLAVLAAVCTLGVLGTLLGLYRAGIIKASEGFTRGVIIATVGAGIALLAVWLLSMFSDAGRSAMGALYGSGPIGIGFSVVMIALAAANLVVDFGVIERGAQQGRPKFYEWAAAMGLVVTIVWLYIEILNLRAKLRGR